MNLTWHIVTKDFRRMRGWLVLWGSILVAKVGLGIFVLASDIVPDEERLKVLSDAYDGLVYLEMLTCYVLTVLIVQEDVLLGTRAFWATRPISAGRLLGAKALAIALMVGVLPVLVTLPWWLWCGLSAGAIATAAMETFAGPVLVALAAMLVAACTDSRQRAFVWSFVFGAAVVTMAALLLAAGGMRAGILVAAVIFIGAILAAVIVQFLQRRVVRSMAALALCVTAGAVVMASTGKSWRLDPSRYVKLKEENATAFASVAVSFDRAWVEGGLRQNSTIAREDWLQTRFTLKGVSPDVAVQSLEAQHVWRWSKDLTLERKGLIGSGWGGWLPLAQALKLGAEVKDPESVRYWEERIAAWRARYPSRRWQQEVPGESFAMGVPVPPAFATRVGKESPFYEAQIWLRVVRPVVLTEVPLQAGGWHRYGTGAFEFRAVSDHHFVVSFVETRPAPWVDSLRGVLSSELWMSVALEPGFYLVNRSLGQVSGAGGDRARLSLNSVRINWWAGERSIPTVRRGEKSVPWPGWIDGATFAVVTGREEAVLSRDVKVEKFELER